jgi:hypothetical protein
MIRRVPRLSLTVFTVLAAGAALPQEPSAPPVAVLTDTVEYCGQLQRMILKRPNRPADINKLLAEGQRMCDHGEVRPGIARLRRALWLLHHRATPP